MKKLIAAIAAAVAAVAVVTCAPAHAQDKTKDDMFVEKHLVCDVKAFNYVEINTTGKIGGMSLHDFRQVHNEGGMSDEVLAYVETYFKHVRKNKFKSDDEAYMAGWKDCMNSLN